MRKFNNEVYEPLIDDLIYESFYIENRTIRGKIATVRQYSEIIIRKIFDIPETEKVMLGMPLISNKIQTTKNSLLINSVNTIRKYGNDNTHTQKTLKPTEEDLHNVLNALMNLYSYLFIQYFEKYRFGSNVFVMDSFSLLPPIIRYITLQYLYINDKDNPAIIYRYILAILKAQNKDSAIKFIEDEKEHLQKVVHWSKEEIKLINSIPALKQSLPQNMYEYCLEKLENVSQILDENGKLYITFEEALPYYEELGHIFGNTDEVNEFNSIMEFCYIGRHKKKNYKDIKSYKVLNCSNIKSGRK